MAYELPPLPYSFDALEPHIDARTMEIHHDRHHNAYVTNVNNAIQGTDLESKSIEDLVSNLSAAPENVRTAVRNNGGGHYNHTLFWKVRDPYAGWEPGGALAEAVGWPSGDLGGFKGTFT